MNQRYGISALTAIFTLLLSLCVPQAQASLWSERTLLTGFMSAVYNVSDSDAFFNGDAQQGGINEDGSFQGTRYGLNIRSRISERIVLASQIFASLEDGSYIAGLDWAFAGFELRDSLTLRAGKIKFPVGILNKYVSVGVAYPWIRPPISIYSEQFAGPQATRESYTGMNLLWEGGAGGWTVNVDLFGGQVDLTDMQTKGMGGLTAKIDWNDVIQLQVSTYSGKMNQPDPDDSSQAQWMPVGTMQMSMHDQSHSATLLGLKMEGKNLVLYAEYAKVEMDVRMRPSDNSGAGIVSNVRNATAQYATLGYRIGNLLPHYSFQKWEREAGDFGNTISTLGFSYNINPSTVFKIEGSNIATEGDALFENSSAILQDTTLVSLGVDVVF